MNSVRGSTFPQNLAKLLGSGARLGGSPPACDGMKIGWNLGMATSANATEISDSLATSGRMHTLMGVRILSLGTALPPRIVTNAELATLGCDPDWIVKRTGIEERRHAAAGVGTSQLAIQAAEQALERAQVSPRDLDLIVVTTATPDTLIPSTACVVQRHFGCAAPAMDLNAACSGFIYGLVTAAQFVKTGSSRRALVIGADLMSRTVNPNDKRTYPLFGDGAGAAILGPGSDEQGLLSYTLGADGLGANLLCIPGGGSKEPLDAESLQAGRQFLVMDGKPVFKWAVRLVADSIRDVLRHARLETTDIAFAVLHQANRRILDAAFDSLGLNPEQRVVNVDRVGNTSAASIPLALDEVYREGRIHSGDHVLLCGFGAGLTWGTAVVRW
jgi:3-oxoacyl-[acyl-carrier-protein] synthase-3